MIYHSYLDQLMMLTPPEVGNLLVALLQYAKGGEEEITVDLTPEALMAFAFMRSRIDIDFQKYRSRRGTIDSPAQSLGYSKSPDTTASGSYPRTGKSFDDLF